jgi:hypothetical protein
VVLRVGVEKAKTLEALCFLQYLGATVSSLLDSVVEVVSSFSWNVVIVSHAVLVRNEQICCDSRDVCGGSKLGTVVIE